MKLRYYSNYSDSKNFTTFGITYHEKTCLQLIKYSHAISAISAITVVIDETDCGNPPRPEL